MEIKTMKKEKIIYKGLGHKIAFKKWSLIVHTTERAFIQPISKELYDVFLAQGYAEEG